ncbi:hypothetical protein BDF19DRAFT_475531 [Syncephalis fuscata]|nr:hypothetical protein BDF19DRAFT_475531 [Syncephalis fuscata]
MILFGTKCLLPLLVLLSAGQNVLALPGLFAKEVNSVSNYKLGKSGAFNIKALTIDAVKYPVNGVHAMEATYSVKGEKHSATVICANGQTNYLPFNIYKSMYSGDYNRFETNDPPMYFYSVIKKLSDIPDYNCYLIVRPKSVKQMKLRKWSLHNAFVRDAYIENGYLVFCSVDKVSPIELVGYNIFSGKIENRLIKEQNDNFYRALMIIYMGDSNSVSMDEASRYATSISNDLAIPEINGQTSLSNSINGQELPPPPYTP